MRLRPRILLFFGATLLVGIVVFNLFTRQLLLSSFLQLEAEEMHQHVEQADSGLSIEFRDLAVTTNDYSYWDRMYDFMRDPSHIDIAGEFKLPRLKD